VPGAEITDVPVAHAERNTAGTVSATAMNVFMLDVIGAVVCVIFGNILFSTDSKVVKLALYYVHF
jgi:phosphoribosyl 1,2-cyclic phosphodiesterase